MLTNHWNLVQIQNRTTIKWSTIFHKTYFPSKITWNSAFLRRKCLSRLWSGIHGLAWTSPRIRQHCESRVDRRTMVGREVGTHCAHVHATCTSCQHLLREKRSQFRHDQPDDYSTVLEFNSIRYKVHLSYINWPRPPVFDYNKLAFQKFSEFFNVESTVIFAVAGLRERSSKKKRRNQVLKVVDRQDIQKSPSRRKPSTSQSWTGHARSRVVGKRGSRTSQSLPASLSKRCGTFSTMTKIFKFLVYFCLERLTHRAAQCSTACRRTGGWRRPSHDVRHNMSSSESLSTSNHNISAPLLQQKHDCTWQFHSKWCWLPAKLKVSTVIVRHNNNIILKVLWLCKNIMT